MANGKKNYFRHSFFARNNIKLLRLKDEVGIGYYFYYFTLLELCGETSADELKEKYEFHDSTIRQLWGVNLRKCRTVSEKMNAVGLLEFKKVEKTFQFTIPKLSKYLGKYTNKNESNRPNKRKVNKIKVNKIKVKEKTDSVFDFEFVYQEYPIKKGKKLGLQRLQKQIKTDKEYQDLLKAVKNYAVSMLDEEKKFIKHFSTFANCWEDWIDHEDEKQKVWDEWEKAISEAKSEGPEWRLD